MSDDIKKEDNQEEIGSKLTDKQRAFCIEYPVDFNGTQAAIRAGYSDNLDAAGVQAHVLLSNTKIRAEIDRILKEREDIEKAEIRARVLCELEKIGFNDIEIDVTMNRNGEIINVSRRDRLKALELLGKYESLFSDNLNVKATIDDNVVTFKTVEDRDAWYKAIKDRGGNKE
jgi:phage terminase small subunit